MTDNALSHIAGLRTLKTLDLTGNQISDKGLVALAELSGLRQLILTDNPISQVGETYINAQLPNCTVYVSLDEAPEVREGP
jgi:Leucine-rich repeat (LRR) protein